MITKKRGLLKSNLPKMMKCRIPFNHPTASFSTSKNKWRKTIWNISCEQHPVVNVCLLAPCCATNEVQRPRDITWRFTNGSLQLLSSIVNDVDEVFCSKSSISLMKELIESNIDSAANTLAGPLSERWLRLQKQRRLIFMLSFVFQLVLKNDHQHIYECCSLLCSAWWKDVNTLKNVPVLLHI